MTSTSIVYNNLQARVESLNQIFTTSSLTTQAQILPLITENEIKHAFQAINTNLGTSLIPQGSASVDAEQMMELSSHVDNNGGSPGTVLLVNVGSSQADSSKFEAKVVNRHGQIISTPLTRCVNGWMSDKGAKHFTTFSSLSEDLLSGMQDILGSLTPIPYLSSDKIETTLTKLSQSESGTYIAFAHAPTQEERSEPGLVAPKKRNVLLWINNAREIKEAHFHFEPSVNQWLNGGPLQFSDAEDVLSDATLNGLISKKISLDSPDLTARPLALE